MSNNDRPVRVGSRVEGGAQPKVTRLVVPTGDGERGARPTNMVTKPSTPPKTPSGISPSADGTSR